MPERIFTIRTMTAEQCLIMQHATPGALLSGIGASLCVWQWVIVAIGYAGILYVMFSGASRYTVYKLIDAGADVNARAEYDRTVLMYAAGDVTSVDYGIILDVLIESGADVNAVDAGGNTALIHAAAKNPQEPVIETLVKAGANINHKNDIELTALMQAVSFNPNPSVVQTLVKLGADVLARSNTGATAIDYLGGYSGNGKIRIMSDEQRNAQIRKILIDAVR